ncbi:hypothetical protein Cgig2_003697 [Carnegiea gigantea]|uniref:Uncharacterized protein n=1 Tax=Carnegiea gigantea TaxID=171969 RepID=A0A9Q1KGY2_9CARY|nr:hypothetical protein Cgig2_003697 [Carnegiea gigantea]
MASSKEREEMASSKEKSRATRVRAKLSEGNREGKEAGETSFRVLYYGAHEVTVPFMWESQPGTPKHPIFTQNDSMLPPLTPPPSYTQTFSPSPTLGSATPSRKTRKPRFFSAFFSSISRKINRHIGPMSSSNLHSGPLSWSTVSSSSSPVSSPPRPGRSSTGYSSFGPKSQSPLFDDDDKHELGSSARDIILGSSNERWSASF